MSEKPSPQSSAAKWTAILFVCAMAGTFYPVWKFNEGHRMWLGAPAFIALFVFSWLLGRGADREEIRKGVGAGCRTLIETGPQWAGAVAVLLLIVVVGCGWVWTWRVPIPMVTGILAGLKWIPPKKKDEGPVKSEKNEPPPMDFWKT